jgi:two-component system OmpR family response regulator
MVPACCLGHHPAMMKLLVVDDSELIRSRLVDWFQNVLGMTDVDTAGTLEQALSRVQAGPPALTILDLHLPDGNAVQIIPALKKLAPGMRVAMLTNDASEFNRARCLQAGADWFFDKSTEFEKVLDLVQEQAALQ